MEDTPPAITRDGFTFNGKFCVEVNGHFHPRCDPATLVALLETLPQSQSKEKGGKASGTAFTPAQQADFYPAQLVHYGLPPLKTRDPAKRRLLAAAKSSNGKTLEIPSAILELESALSKEWHERNSKMSKKGAISGNKRKAASPQQSDNVESSKKAKLSVVKPKTRAQIQAEISALTEDNAQNLLRELLIRVPGVEELLAVESTLLSKTATTKVTKAVKGKIEKSGSSEIPTSSNSPWAGIYKIRSSGSYLEDRNDEKISMTLELYPSSTSAHMWGTFNFGCMSGVLRSRIWAPTNAQTERSFVWRGRDRFNEDDRLQSICDEEAKLRSGVIIFLGEGKIKGGMNGNDYACAEGDEFSRASFTFYGEIQKNEGKVVPPKAGPQQRLAVKNWKKEWRNIKSDGDSEPYKSDTTDGDREHSDDSCSDQDERYDEDDEDEDEGKNGEYFARGFHY